MSKKRREATWSFFSFQTVCTMLMRSSRAVPVPRSARAQRNNIVNKCYYKEVVLRTSVIVNIISEYNK
jgi:hypothetical protein